MAAVAPPKPWVTFSLPVCPGEPPHRPETEHWRAPYTHRPGGLHKEQRAAPQQFQRDVRADDLRTRGSPKFVTAIEWRAREDSNFRPLVP